MADTKDHTPLETCALYTCKLIGWVWNTLTILPWYFLSGNYRVPRVGEIQSKSVTGAPGGPYRALQSLEELSEGCNGVDTLDELFNAILMYIYGMVDAPKESRQNLFDVLPVLFDLLAVRAAPPLLGTSRPDDWLAASMAYFTSLLQVFLSLGSDLINH